MATLTLDSLSSQGAFTGAPVAKEIEWEGNGETHTATVYVRPLSYRAAVYDAQAAGGKLDGLAGRIAASVCDENGKAVFKPEDITGEYEDGTPVMCIDEETGEETPRGPMSRNLTLALLNAIGEVNSLGKPTNSTKRASSGAS